MVDEIFEAMPKQWLRRGCGGGGLRDLGYLERYKRR